MSDSSLLFVPPEGSRRPYRICDGGAASALGAAPWSSRQSLETECRSNGKLFGMIREALLGA